MAVGTEKNNVVHTVNYPGNIEYKIEIATQTLERNIGFITNCDYKASIILAAIGVFFTIILTNEGINKILNIIDSCINAKTFCSIFYVICFLLVAFTLALGIFYLSSVLVAKTAEEADELNGMNSRIFFSGIRKHKDFNSYRSNFYSMEQKELLDELVAQIYRNADIATQKYKKYNRGLIYTLIGFLAFFIILLVGIYLY